MTNEELMNAAEMIKQNCAESECDSCVFCQLRPVNPFDDKTRVCVMMDNDTPCDWNLKEDDER